MRCRDVELGEIDTDKITPEEFRERIDKVNPMYDFIKELQEETKAASDEEKK